MKKTKILVPAVALLALGMAASTTATVAWFTAGAAAKNYVDATSNVSVVKTSVTLKAVTFTASQVSNSNTELVLTDSTGKTKYYAGANLITIDIPSGQHGNSVITAQVVASVQDGTSADLASSLASIYADSETGFTEFTLRARAKASSQVRVDDATTEATHDYATAVGTSYVDFVCGLQADGSVSTWAGKAFTASVAGRDGQEDITDYTLDERTVELVLGTGTGNSFTPFNS